MSTFNVLLVLAVLGSIAMCLITWNRVIVYNKKYHLPESQYTRLFRVFTKEHIAIIYSILVSFHAIITIWFILTL